jgi:hypothetical protein
MLQFAQQQGRNRFLPLLNTFPLFIMSDTSSQIDFYTTQLVAEDRLAAKLGHNGIYRIANGFGVGFCLQYPSSHSR